MSPLNRKGITEKLLIELCLKQDREAQKQLFDLYAGKMKFLCMRYARYSQEAEDFTQEGFIRVFKNLHQFNHQGSFEGWIRRIMVNTCLKNLKRKYVTNEISGIEDYQHQETYPEIFSKLSVEELMKLVNQLPDGYKTVFNLFAIEGYSHKEIGKLLNIGESTSRSQLAKARKILQKKVLLFQKIAV